MSVLRPRSYRFRHEFRVQNPSAKSFLAPQREHPKQPMPKRKAAKKR